MSRRTERTEVHFDFLLSASPGGVTLPDSMDPQVALQHRAQVEEFRRKYRTGLVTLLFTDVVGSTRLKQTLGDRHGAALIQSHHALVRDLLSHFADAQVIDTAPQISLGFRKIAQKNLFRLSIK